MATAKTPAVSNVYSKLLAARSMFLAAGAKKSGKNMHMKFTYFELDDIVPIAQPIFADVGLLPIVNFTDTEATMTLYNVDNVEEFITFTSPMRDLGGNMAINPIQSLGAVQTYLRRYLYMICLDIVEPDYTEANLVKPTEMPTVPAPKPTPVEVKNAPVVEVKPVVAEEPKPVELPKSKIPLSQAQRDAVKEQITDANGKADATQITALKNALKAYSAKCEDKESKKAATEYISKIAIETTSFKNLTKVRWEELMTEVKAKMPKE